MFINSIFLPKTISDQTVPEGSFGKIGNFSHLFSNVFRIVNEDQESNLPFQSASSNPESIQNTPNELLKVSLFSDNQLTLENSNISMIVSAFLAKLNPEENGEQLANTNTIKINQKTPKYFSLSKNEFIKEIKNIIETLNSGDTKSLENVEISLIANGQSIKINPLTTNIVELENWANEQLKSNSDFEILVKSGQKKLSVDVEPVKIDNSKTIKPIEIISIKSEDENYADSKSVVDKKVIELFPSLKNTKELGSTFKQPLEGLKQTRIHEGVQTVKQEVPTVQKQVNPSLNFDPKILADKNIFNSVPISNDPKTQGKFEAQNISSIKNNLSNEFTSGIQNELIAKTESSPKLEHVLTHSNLDKKQLSTEKQFENSTKTITTETKVKPDVLQTEKNLNKTETIKQNFDLNVKGTDKTENKITLKANQKINSLSVNKNTVQEKIYLNDLMKKTDVKTININVQKFVKSNSTSAPQNQAENLNKIIPVKENINNTRSQIVNNEVKKVISDAQEIKQPIVKKSLNNITEEKSTHTKSVYNTKLADTVKVQETPKFRTQKEVSVGNKNNNIENSSPLKIEKPVLVKAQLTKIPVNNQQTIKANNVTEPSGKVKVENIILEQFKPSQVNSLKPQIGTNAFDNPGNNLNTEIKSEQKPVVLKSQIPELPDSQEFVGKDKPVLPKIETNKNSLNNQQIEKDNAGTEQVVKTNINTNGSETSRKNLISEIKTIQQPVSSKLTSPITEDDTVKIQNNNTVKEVVKESLKETNTVKTISDTNNKTEKTELNSSTSIKTASKNLTEQTDIGNVKKSLKENIDHEAKPESISKNQFENKNVKIDLMQRRVYSKIPPLEVIAEENEIKNTEQSVEANKNKNIRTLDESIKPSSFTTESKPISEKQVWVKVSLEKHDVENVSEVKKQAPQQSKITIDTNNDGLKKESNQNNYSEKESHESNNLKTQKISVENSVNKEQGPILQNQSANNQQELVSNLKPELKTEYNPFKSSLHSEETRLGSRAAEMVEKIKVISSGELVREVYKVFESGEKQSIVLRLVPKELGSIKIMLDTIDNILTAKVEVENESVGHIIRNNVDQLKQSLLQSGVSVNSINISYHNPDQKENGFQNNKRKNPSYKPGNDFEEVDESILSKKMGYNTYEYLA